MAGLGPGDGSVGDGVVHIVDVSCLISLFGSINSIKGEERGCFVRGV